MAAAFDVLDDMDDFTAVIIEPAPGTTGTRGLFTRPDPRIDPRIERRRTPATSNDGQGILYAEDFDFPADLAAEAAPPPEPEPVFSAADIEAAHTAGHRAGFAAAAADQDALRANLQVAALQSIADALASTRHEAAGIAHQTAQALSGAIMALLSAALPKLTQTHADAEITAVLETLLPGLRAEPVLRIRIHPDLETCVQRAWTELTQDEPAGSLQLTPDATMAPGDIRLSWADGRASRTTADIWDAIRGALASLDMPSMQELVHAQ